MWPVYVTLKMKNNYEKVLQKIVWSKFCACKELSTTSIGKGNFWSKLFILNIY